MAEKYYNEFFWKKANEAEITDEATIELLYQIVAISIGHPDGNDLYMKQSCYNRCNSRVDMDGINSDMLFQADFLLNQFGLKMGHESEHYFCNVKR